MKYACSEWTRKCGSTVSVAARRACATICPPYSPPHGYFGPMPTQVSGPWGSRFIIVAKFMAHAVAGVSMPAANSACADRRVDGHGDHRDVDLVEVGEGG